MCVYVYVCDIFLKKCSSYLEKNGCKLASYITEVCIPWCGMERGMSLSFDTSLNEVLQISMRNVLRRDVSARYQPLVIFLASKAAKCWVMRTLIESMQVENNQSRGYNISLKSAS